MATGNTTTDALDASLDTVVAAARIVREQKGGMAQLVDRQQLSEGTGLSWKEVSYRKLTAEAITETQALNNPQQLQDDALTLTPTVIGIQTLITDRVAARITKKGLAKTVMLAQNAIQRSKDENGIVVLDGGSTGASPGAGATLTSGHISAAKVRITSNVTEPGLDMGPIYTVLHGFQIKDLQDELVAGVGTYVLDEGETAKAYRNGFSGSLVGTMVHENGNIAINGTDCKGGVFAKMGIVLVEGRAPRKEVRREPHIGGGATSYFHYDEFVYGERLAGGTTSGWVFEIQSDATAPTS